MRAPFPSVAAEPALSSEDDDCRGRFQVPHLLEHEMCGHIVEEMLEKCKNIGAVLIRVLRPFGLEAHLTLNPFWEANGLSSLGARCGWAGAQKLCGVFVL